jgi:hypothetical protein
MKKVWYEVKCECVVENPSLDMRKGDVVVLAKVKSLGNARSVALELQKVYKEVGYVWVAV